MKHFPTQPWIDIYLPILQTIPYGAVQLEKGESHSFIKQSSSQQDASDRLVLLAPPLFPLSHSDVTTPGRVMTSLLQSLLLSTQFFAAKANQLTAEPCKSAWRIPNKLAASKPFERKRCSNCTTKDPSKWSGAKDEFDSWFSIVSLYPVIKLTLRAELWLDACKTLWEPKMFRAVK